MYCEESAVCVRPREFSSGRVEKGKKKPAWVSGPEWGQKPKLALYQLVFVYLRWAPAAIGFAVAPPAQWTVEWMAPCEGLTACAA